MRDCSSGKGAGRHGLSSTNARLRRQYADSRPVTRNNPNYSESAALQSCQRSHTSHRGQIVAQSFEDNIEERGSSVGAESALETIASDWGEHVVRNPPSVDLKLPSNNPIYFEIKSVWSFRCW